MDGVRFATIVASIVLAALIVRIIYVWYDVLITLACEVFDDDYRDDYFKTYVHLVGAIVVTGICLFLYIIVYQLWANWCGSSCKT